MKSYNSDTVWKHRFSRLFFWALAAGLCLLVLEQNFVSAAEPGEKVLVLQPVQTEYLVGTYLEYLEDSFLIEEANRYDIKGKSYIGTPMKYYFMDLGLRNARLKFRQMEITHSMELKDILEK